MTAFGGLADDIKTGSKACTYTISLVTFRPFRLVMIRVFLLVVLIVNSHAWDLEIQRLWNGELLESKDFVQLCINQTVDNDAVEIHIRAPFYDDPAPDGEPGEAFYGLWEYEVAEVFFLADNKCDGTPDYLELEFGPHGQHLGLYLHGVRNAIKHSFPIEYEAQINKENGSWTGKAKISKEYFPPGVNKMNAYAINGPSDGRIYKALYPVPGPQADYHRLEFFVPFDAKFIEELYSKSWIEAIQNPIDE